MILGIALIAFGIWLAVTKQWHLNIGNARQMFYDVPRYFTTTIGVCLIAIGAYLILR